ncbi:hypothetical protein BgiBS90_003391 [Biomphalaria glabrata]|nr:hypothetical protein BgiBS90_003391 [Biomphalaria glabrata]
MLCSLSPQAFIDTYKLHNLISREITPLTCPGYVWAWHIFYDCVLTTANLSGYFLAGVSSVLWLVGWVIQVRHVYQVSVTSVWFLVWLYLVADVFSLIGAVMSMQIMLIILNDVMVCSVEVCLLACLALITCSKCFKVIGFDANLYKQFKLLFSKPSSGTVFLALTFVFILLVVSLTNTLTIFSGIQEIPMTHEYFVLLTMLGRLFGCLSCFCRLGIEVTLVRIISLPTSTANVSWRISCCIHVLSDMLFLLAVLLQSGGFQMAISTLPWLIKRFMQAFLLIGKLCCLTWTSVCCHSDIAHSADTGQQDGGNKANLKYKQLVDGSESDTSEDHILYDKAWTAVPAKFDQQYQQFNNVEQLGFLQKLDHRHDVISTTESDWTSLSQEQEITINQYEIKENGRKNETGEQTFRHLCHDLKSDRPDLSLDLTSSVERVKSWISSSTPDEEMPPSLTLTLNLDSPHRNGDLNSELDHRRMFYSGMVLSPRKNSF